MAFGAWHRTLEAAGVGRDFDRRTLELEFAIEDSKITVRRERGKIVVSVPVRLYRRNGRQMMFADSVESESDLDKFGMPNNALLTAIAKTFSWQDQLESDEFEDLEDTPKQMVSTAATLGECSR